MHRRIVIPAGTSSYCYTALLFLTIIRMQMFGQIMQSLVFYNKMSLGFFSWIQINLNNLNRSLITPTVSSFCSTTTQCILLATKRICWSLSSRLRSLRSSNETRTILPCVTSFTQFSRSIDTSRTRNWCRTTTTTTGTTRMWWLRIPFVRKLRISASYWTRRTGQIMSTKPKSVPSATKSAAASRSAWPCSARSASRATRRTLWGRMRTICSMS